MARYLLGAGSLLVALAIAMGAFGAHGLHLSEYSRLVYEKAVFYHVIHALGIVALASLVSSGLISEGAARWVVRCHAGGILFFSGSLYLLAITEQRWLGAVTPIGGLLFIVGWLMLSVLALRRALS